MEKEKVYKVEFMTYTNAMKNTVSNNAEDITDKKFIDVGHEPFLVRESELDFYQKYGNGFRSIEFVGNLPK